MGRARSSTVLRRVPAAALAGGAAMLLGACGGSSAGPADLVAGKQQFVEKCGACHVLNRADTRGIQGPNLDEAFAQSLRDGMGRDGVRAAVYDQILSPSTFDVDGGTRADGSAQMPAGIVTGQAARDVAAYVGEVAARPGEDSGALATAVPAAGGGEPAVARNGVLDIAADSGGQLAYVTERASGPAGRLTVQSANEANIPHNIVIDGKGEGAVVQGGGVSRFTAQFDAGAYTYYCSVPGHREGGMQGRLTVR